MDDLLSPNGVLIPRLNCVAGQKRKRGKNHIKLRASLPASTEILLRHNAVQAAGECPSESADVIVTYLATLSGTQEERQLRLTDAGKRREFLLGNACAFPQKFYGCAKTGSRSAALARIA